MPYQFFFGIPEILQLTIADVDNAVSWSNVAKQPKETQAVLVSALVCKENQYVYIKLLYLYQVSR